jgi:hypothetical protein
VFDFRGVSLAVVADGIFSRSQQAGKLPPAMVADGIFSVNVGLHGFFSA